MGMWVRSRKLRGVLGAKNLLETNCLGRWGKVLWRKEELGGLKRREQIPQAGVARERGPSREGDATMEQTGSGVWG